VGSHHYTKNLRVPSIGVTPILKAYDKLLDPMEFEGETISPLEYVYGFDISDGWIKHKIYDDLVNATDDASVHRDFSVQAEEGGYYEQTHIVRFYMRLSKIGFGAVENDESPTGYVDIFTNCPCVRAE
jgi:hypothetical protein